MSHKIMLVEDDAPILELMEILLRRIGYEPILVPDVQEALERVRNNPPERSKTRGAAKAGHHNQAQGRH